MPFDASEPRDEGGCPPCASCGGLMFPSSKKIQIFVSRYDFESGRCVDEGEKIIETKILTCFSCGLCVWDQRGDL